MKKSIIAILLTSIVAISLIGCGSSKSTTSTDTKEAMKQDEVKKEETKSEAPKVEVTPGITKEYIEAKLSSSEKIEIINISKDGENYYTIDFKVKDVVSDSYYEKSILNEIQQISKILTEASLVQGNEFFFEAKGSGKDKYGNTGDMNYGQGFVKGDELAKCKFDNMKPEDMKKVMQSFGVNPGLKK